MDYEYFMTKALQQAETALAAGDCTNEVDHAEMVALRRLISLKTNINLREVILFSTLEPCLMCFGALMISDIGQIVFAYEDAMGGGTQCDLTKLPPLYKENQISVIPNILRKKSLQLLKAFFANPANIYLKGSLLASYTLRQ